MDEIAAISSLAVAKTPKECGALTGSERTAQAKYPVWELCWAGSLLAAGDALAVLLSTSVARVLVTAETARVDLFAIDLYILSAFLASCFAADLYGRAVPHPILRFRRRLIAISALAGTTALAVTALSGSLAVLGYLGACFVALLPLSTYTENAINALLIAPRRRFLVAPAEANPRHGAIAYSPAPDAIAASESVILLPAPAAMPRLADGSRRIDVLLKRLMDYLITIPAAIFTLPIMIVFVALIILTNPGPAFYRQSRVGRNGKLTRILKLRTMYVDAEQRLEQYLRDNCDASHEWKRFFKLRNDPRILPGIGNLLRRTSLDELPQIWNIWRGDMTLVGPRPFPAYHVARFDSEFQDKRTSVTPGLTGLWQVMARSNADLEAQRALDLFYIEHKSIWLDLYIIIATVPAVLSGRGAR